MSISPAIIEATGRRNNILQAYNIITGASNPPSLTSGKTDMSISPAIIEATGRNLMLLCIAVGRKMKEFYPLIEQKVADVMKLAQNPDNDEKKSVIEKVAVPEIAELTNKEVEKLDEN